MFTGQISTIRAAKGQVQVHDDVGVNISALEDVAMQLWQRRKPGDVSSF